MTVQLGNIVLDDTLRLHGIETAKDIAVDQIVTLDGSSVVQLMPLNGGWQLYLVASLEGNSLKGVLLRSQVLAIKEMAAAGQPVTLTHHLATYTVLITSTAEVEPVIDYADPQPDDWYVGPIKLIEV